MFGKVVEILEKSVEPLHSFREWFSFRYNDAPFSDRAYYANARWFKLLYEHYFRISHHGAVSALHRAAEKSHVMVVSNHANTLEALSLYYYFYLEKLGMIQALVFPAVFRLPLIRELFRSGHAVPASVPAGVRVLSQNHLLVFPEGMDFVKRYREGGGFHFHGGFLQIARAFLEANPKQRVTLVPVAHDGFDDAVKFWVIQHPWLVSVLKPLLGYPYAVVPKLPFLLPAKVVYQWGEPCTLSLKDLDTEAKILRWKHRFEATLSELHEQAKRLRREA